jgi:hypothetical protein
VDYTNGFTYVVSEPVITNEPEDETVGLGGSVSFTVAATGATPLIYQWFFNSTNLPGATNCYLTFSNVQALNAGPYQAMVSNLYGAATSQVATLSVLGSQVSISAALGGSLQYSNGQVVLLITGLTGQGPVVIQTSPDLTNWTSIYTNPPGFGQFQFTDTNASNFSFGFYRAYTPPPQ